ncbi:hypothetical protein F2A37_08245 [Pseudomonas chlororaphis]|nr:hypothetical protein F2A37_08245 [Pseudomonas chlororaphis]
MTHDAGADESDFSHERILFLLGSTPSVGASLLAKNGRAPCSFRMPASSLTIFASKLAPTAMNDDAVCDQIALWLLSQPRPASVVVSGLYSQPTQPW